MAWDGPPPAAGDVVVLGEAAAVVDSVAEGPGVGQYRLTCTTARLIRWTG